MRQPVTPDLRADQPRDLARTSFQLLALAALIATSFWIVRPFLVAVAWATMIVVATWPLYLHVRRWLGDRRSLAVASMTLVLTLTLFVPIYFGIAAIVTNTGQLAEWSKSLETLAIPPPPAWLATLPVIGGKLATRWEQLAATGSEE